MYGCHTETCGDEIHNLRGQGHKFVEVGGGGRRGGGHRTGGGAGEGADNLVGLEESLKIYSDSNAG